MKDQNSESDQKIEPSGEQYASLKDAFEAKITQPWAGIPRWFFFVVWGATWWLVHLPFDFVVTLVQFEEYSISEVPWEDIRVFIDWSAFFFTFYSAPKIYKRILRKN